MRTVTLLVCLLAVACSASGGGEPDRSADPLDAVSVASATPTTTEPTSSGSITASAPRETSTTRAAPKPTPAGLPRTCGAPRRPGDEIAQAEEFLRAVVRGDDVDDRIATIRYAEAGGSTEPTSVFLGRVHASLAELRVLPSDLTLVGAPELASRCLDSMPAGCDFVGDFHTLCFATVFGDGGPMGVVEFTSAGHGYEAFDIVSPR